jgi:UDP-3-O-[3-hydroxymyristoyl] glucosamine N-acyltransferase
MAVATDTWARQCKMRSPDGGSGVAVGAGLAVGDGVAVGVGAAIGLPVGIGEDC